MTDPAPGRPGGLAQVAGCGCWTLIMSAGAFVVAVVVPPWRTGAIYAWVVALALTVAIGIGAVALGGWRLRPPQRRTAALGTAVLLSTAVALLAPVAAVAVVLFDASWTSVGRPLLIAAGVGFLLVLVLGFRGPGANRDRGAGDPDNALGVGLLAACLGGPLAVGAVLLSGPTGWNTALDVAFGVGLALAVCGPGLGWLRAATLTRPSAATRACRAVGTVGWLGTGAGLVLFAFDATELVAVWVLAIAPALVLLGHGVVHGRSQHESSRDRGWFVYDLRATHLALLGLAALVLPAALLGVAADVQRGDPDYWGAYGVETDVVPGSCVTTIEYWNGLVHYAGTSCSGSTWTVGGAPVTGSLEAHDDEAAGADGTYRAFVLGDEARSAGLVGPIAPTVVLGHALPGQLLWLVPVELLLLACYALALRRSRRDLGRGHRRTATLL
jgi:hypothetical protein